MNDSNWAEGAGERLNQYNKKTMKKVCGILAVFIAIMLNGCATEPVEKPPEMYWPTPPETPRVKFVDYIIGSLDVKGERKGKFKELVFGDVKETTFAKPTYVKVRDGIMYVTDVNRIQVYNFPEKKFKVIFAGFRNLTGIAIDNEGSLYVGDSILRAVFKITPDGKYIKRFAQPPDGFFWVGGMALDQKRKLLYVVDPKRRTVDVFNEQGDYVKSWGEQGTELGQFNLPYDVAVDDEGNVAVLDSGNFRVQIFSPDGKVISAFGGIGTQPGMFSRPRGITFDRDGHIYVTDAAFGNFQIFDYFGSVYLAVGQNGTGPGQFLLPLGIYVDEDDVIYVIDQANKRVQLFKYLRESGEPSEVKPFSEPLETPEEG